MNSNLEEKKRRESLLKNMRKKNLASSSWQGFFDYRKCRLEFKKKTNKKKQSQLVVETIHEILNINASIPSCYRARMFTSFFLSRLFISKTREYVFTIHIDLY